MSRSLLDFTIERLNEHHRTREFDCGDAFLNRFLKNDALACQQEHSGITTVVANEKSIIAYYTLACSKLEIKERRVREEKNLQDSYPVVHLGRLAVDRRYQNEGLGKQLIAHIYQQVREDMANIGCTMIMCEATATMTTRFYEPLGFFRATLRLNRDGRHVLYIPLYISPLAIPPESSTAE